MTDLKARLIAFTKALAQDAEPLWPSGLAILIVLIGSLILRTVLGVYGELYEWSLYLTLGTVYPAVLLFLAHRKPLPAQRAGWPDKFTLAVVVVYSLLVAYLFFRAPLNAVIVFVFVHFALIVFADRKRERTFSPSGVLVILLVLTVAWKFSTGLLWWSTFPAWFFSGDNLAETVYRFTIFALALLLVFFNLSEVAPSGVRSRTRFLTASNVFALLVIAIASVRSDQLFNTMSYSHWSVVVGPAEMVRQGGWLLWDVPAQYGFLNTLLVAALPFKSIWQSAYFLNSLLLFLSAAFLFFVLRSISSGVRSLLFSLAVTLSAVFLMSGWPPALLGPQVFPSIGPFRFFWCYALVAVLIWEFTGSDEHRYRVPVIGTLIWLIGTLWSSESAVYCAATWLPAYTLIAIRRARTDLHRPAKRVRVTIAWLVAPILILAVTLGLISAFYVIRLGHAPDWRSFFEYSISFAGGFFSIPMTLRGPVWVLFLIFGMISTTAVYFLRDGLTQKIIIPIAGAWGALWSMSSYFVSRSHENNLTILSTIMCVVIGLTLYLFARLRRRDAWVSIIKMSYVPFLAVLLTATFGNAGFLRLYLSSPAIGYQKNIDTHLPKIDPSLLELFRVAQIRSDDPMIYRAVRVNAVEPAADGLSHDHGVHLPAWATGDGELISTPRIWLPTAPFVLVLPLAEERRQAYMQRFVSRARMSGWLAQNKKEQPYTSSPWFYNELMKTHTPTKTFENADWQLIWFEYKPGN